MTPSDRICIRSDGAPVRSHIAPWAPHGAPRRARYIPHRAFGAPRRARYNKKCQKNWPAPRIPSKSGPSGPASFLRRLVGSADFFRNSRNRGLPASGKSSKSSRPRRPSQFLLATCSQFFGTSCCTTRSPKKLADPPDSIKIWPLGPSQFFWPLALPPATGVSK